MKKVLKALVILLLLAALGFAAYRYHINSINEAVAQQKLEQERNELLEERIKEINEQLSITQQENEDLHLQIDAFEESYYFDSAEIEGEIKEIAELATAEYCYTNVGTLDSSINFTFSNANIEIPLTKKTAIITMDGVIKAGVDVNEIKISSNEATKTITVTIPEAKLLSNELDENSTQYYDQSSGLFNRITLQDDGGLRRQIKEKAEATALTNGVYEQARRNAESTIRCMLEAIPGLTDSYTIRFN